MQEHENKIASPKIISTHWEKAWNVRLSPRHLSFFQGRYICRWALLVLIRFELNSALPSNSHVPFNFSKFFCKSIQIKEFKLEHKQTGWYYSNFSHIKGKSNSINQLFPVQQILKYRRPIFPHFSFTINFCNFN